MLHPASPVEMVRVNIPTWKMWNFEMQRLCELTLSGGDANPAPEIRVRHGRREVHWPLPHWISLAGCVFWRSFHLRLSTVSSVRRYWYQTNQLQLHLHPQLPFFSPPFNLHLFTTSSSSPPPHTLAHAVVTLNTTYPSLRPSRLVYPPPRLPASLSPVSALQ